MAKKKRAASDSDGTVISSPSKTRRTQVIPADSIPTFYVNSVNFELTNWDVRLRLGQIQSADDAVINVAEVARVFMSHEHFKAYVAAMNGIIQKMEHAEQSRLAKVSTESGKTH